MRRQRETEPREYYSCANCQRDVYFDPRTYLWTHASSGRPECVWMAVPNLDREPTPGFRVE